jgi:Enolase, C-terminal TIM barrel domain
MDVAASEFYSEKDQKYDLNFKAEVHFDYLSIGGKKECFNTSPLLSS